MYTVLGLLATLSFFVLLITAFLTGFDIIPTELGAGVAFAAFLLGLLSTATLRQDDVLGHGRGDALAHGIDGHYLTADGRWKFDGQLMTSDIDGWLAALERIRTLDFDVLIPGHGPVTDRSALDDQRAILLEWRAAVAAAVAEGLSREETQARVNFQDRFPVDIGQEYMMDYIMSHNAGALWDRMTAQPPRDG